MSVFHKFPYEDYRDGQRYLLDRLQKCVEHPKVNFVIVEAPTGFGKTGVAGAIAAHNGPSYFLTDQKVHQDQLQEEFPKDTEVAKGQRNYSCGEERDPPCEDVVPSRDIRCHRKPSTEFQGKFAATSHERGELRWQPGLGDPCPYMWNKTRALEADIACLNYSYFFNETYYSGDFGPRNVIIADEAHKVEQNMQSFLSFRVDDFVTEETGLDLDDRGDNVSEWEDWILGPLKEAVNGKLEQVNEEVEHKWESTDEDPDWELLDMQDKLDEILCNINRFGFEYDDDYFGEMDWAVERKYEDGKLKHVEFTPVSVAPFAERFLFDYADTTILMSATILDQEILTRSLGISKYSDSTYTFRFPSPFPPDIRPVVHYNGPEVKHNNWAQTFPKTVELLDKICQRPEHIDEKGLIHTVSYKNEAMIRKHASRPVRERLISHENRDRDEVISEFRETNSPKILMSPAAFDGLDFTYDISRFQIMPKVPFLSLGSEAVQLKQEQDPRWYDWRTAVRCIQSWGRSVRARDDYAKTYILDGNFRDFYNRNQDFFPDYVEEAMEKGTIVDILEDSLAT